MNNRIGVIIKLLTIFWLFSIGKLERKDNFIILFE